MNPSEKILANVFGVRTDAPYKLADAKGLYFSLVSPVIKAGVVITPHQENK